MGTPVVEHASVEATLHVWRTAAQAVATDPQAERRQAYEAAIQQVSEQLSAYHSRQELMEQSWSIELWALAALAGLTRDGRVLNYQVVAAAACWQRMGQIMQEASAS